MKKLDLYKRLRSKKNIECNYHSISIKGKIVRYKLYPDKEFLPNQVNPDILDCAINTKCLANCPYCYVSATKSGVNFDNIIDKIVEVFHNPGVSPYVMAIGGHGEPILHPDFPEFLSTCLDLDILPTYTTSGLGINSRVLEATEDFCPGVAVSCHPHLEKVWRRTIDELLELKETKVNIHLVVGESGTAEKTKSLYDEYSHKISSLVLLPYQSVGRAKEIETEEEFHRVFETIRSFDNLSKISFGALFHNFLLKNEQYVEEMDIGIFDPDAFSGYRILDDSYKTLRMSSYDLNTKTVKGTTTWENH